MNKRVCEIVCAFVFMTLPVVASDKSVRKSLDVMTIQRRLTQVERRVSTLAGEVHRERDPLVDAMESYDPDYVCILDRITQIEDRLIRLERLQQMTIYRGRNND